MANRIAGITIEIDGNVTKLQKALGSVDKNLKTTQTNLKDVNKLLKLDPKNTDLLKQKQKLLNDAISQTKEKLNAEKEALAQLKAADQTPEVTRQMEALQRQIADDEAALESFEDQHRSFGSVAAQQLSAVGDKLKEIGGKLQEAGDKIQSVGKGLSEKVTAPIMAVGTASVLAATDFEDAIAKLSTIADTSEETGVPLKNLEEQIMELSDKTGISASEIANNVYDAISAGQDTADAVSFVENATSLARAGFTSSSSALDILTTAMNAYGLEAEDVTRVSDILINTQNLGKTTVDQLASSMGKVIPTAKANGVELETLAGAYAIMTSNGIATAESTTYMNSMLNELGKKGSKAADAFAKGTEHIKEGGLTMAEAMEQGWELTDVLSILDEQAAESGTSISNMFGSAEAGKAATVLWDNAEKLNDAVGSMRESTGSTEEAFGKLDTTSQNAKISLNMAKNTLIEIGQTVLPMVTPLLEKLREVIQTLKEKWEALTPEQQNMIIKIAAIAAAIGPVLVIIGTLVSSIGSVISICGSVFSVIGSIVGVLGGPLTIAIGAIIAIGVLLWQNWDTIKEKAGALRDWVVEKWTAIKEGVSNAVTAAKDAVGEKMLAMKDLAQEKLSAIQSAYDEAGGGIQGIVSAAMEGVKQYFTTGYDVINTLTGGRLNDLKEKFTSKFDTIKEKVRSAIDFIKGLFNFEWHLPDIKLPHFSIEGSFSLMPPSVPHLSVQWYRKAYNDPILFTRPTVLGTPYGLKGFGDGSGAEIVMGLNKLREMTGNNVTVNMTVTTQPGQDNAAIAQYTSDMIMRKVRSVQSVWA